MDFESTLKGKLICSGIMAAWSIGFAAMCVLMGI